ncbi:hypothetical protein LNV08_11670 [Paucibacter sp. TC2R-5]|uniref:hypothetical protein n=1 Tax=Paucibacter sp. TC2R-5 TaxID=2893555 RepID=UPI0021E4918F|nr:hypothetical protein [Paucibacter sp. TC2R-5]MCV2359627.1 hypothetical protein [Paucibacter sp. TC2R-5]
MKVIKPIAVTDAILVSSTAPENDYPAWGAGTAYALGARVILASTHRIYESLQAANTGHAPDSNATWWLDVGPTNRWACFDQQISTATVLASPLNVTLAPGYVNSVALLALVGGAATVTVTDGPGGATVYNQTVQLDGTLIADWYQYVWEAFNPLTELVLTDLPPYINARVIVSITGGGSVACGGLVVGTVYELGDTRPGARIGVIDYSRKDTDAFGITTFVKRAYSKRMSVSLSLPTAQVSKVQQLIGALRATPCVWIGSPGAQYQALIVFGFYRDFSIVVEFQTYSACNLEIEGLT